VPLRRVAPSAIEHQLTAGTDIRGRRAYPVRPWRDDVADLRRLECKQIAVRDREVRQERVDGENRGIQIELSLRGQCRVRLQRAGGEDESATDAN